MLTFANNQSSALALPAGNADTQILVADALKLFLTPTPLQPALITLEDDAGNREIVLAIGGVLVSHDTQPEVGPHGGCRLTIVRGIEGTAPRAFSAGAKVELRLTAGAAKYLQRHCNADSILTQGGTILTQQGNVLTVDDVQPYSF